MLSICVPILHKRKIIKLFGRCNSSCAVVGFEKACILAKAEERTNGQPNDQCQYGLKFSSKLLALANFPQPRYRTLLQFWPACTAVGRLSPSILNCCLHFHDEIT